MGFKAVLKKGLAVTKVVGPALGPWGAIAAMAANAAISAEEKHGDNKGDVKRAEATSRLGDATPVIVDAVRGATGHELQDPVLLEKGFAQLNEGMVAILNAFGMLKQGETDGTTRPK